MIVKICWQIRLEIAQLIKKLIANITKANNEVYMHDKIDTTRQI